MLRPKKNSYEEFNNEKNSCGSKIPQPPHNFSNALSLIEVSMYPLFCLDRIVNVSMV